jgi:hypothetical protein
MAELVAEIERRRYLHRTTDPAGRRAKIIEFTDQGWATANLACPRCSRQFPARGFHSWRVPNGRTYATAPTRYAI